MARRQTSLPRARRVRDAGGQTWVLRTNRADDKVPAFDVFDGTGKLVGRITLAPGTRLVGFGNGTMYTIRVDDDDLQYLQRHRLSAPLDDSRAGTPIPITKKPGKI